VATQGSSAASLLNTTEESPGRRPCEKEFPGTERSSVEGAFGHWPSSFAATDKGSVGHWEESGRWRVFGCAFVVFNYYKD